MSEPCIDPQTAGVGHGTLPYPGALPRASTSIALGEGLGGLEAERPLLLDALARIGIGPELRDALMRAARFNGSSIADEIIAGRHAAAEDVADATATVLRLERDRIGAGSTILRDGRGSWRMGQRHIWNSSPGNRTHLHIAPALETVDEVADKLARSGRDLGFLRVTTLNDIRRFQAEASEDERSTRARLSLAMDRNGFSARDTLRPLQASLLTLALVAVLACWLRWPEVSWSVTHLTFSLLALASNGLRAAVLLVPKGDRDGPATPPVRAERAEALPVYSVLVALHREAAMARAVVEAMARLDWPRSRLEVFFVCEANDPETIAAVEQAIADEANFTVVATPRSHPQTKPKALNFALPLTQGEFVVLYDAEDRPDPAQLRAAHARFRGSPPRLACLQAPLSVRDGAHNWLTAHFAMEYAALFRAVLPWLASHGLPVPLGGTSNHFRRSVLVEVGGWDSHNVAEDADLGMRLSRAGYTVGTILPATSESATTRWRDWLQQRTRWVKGWMQTWLVHTRHPVRLLRELGVRRFLVFQLLFAGMVGTAVMHVFFATTLTGALAVLLGGGSVTIELGALMVLDAANILGAWTIHAALVSRTLSADERPMMRRLPTLWGYWLAVTLAVCRALRQLASDPHFWEKTPHGEALQTTGRRSGTGPLHLAEPAASPAG